MKAARSSTADMIISDYKGCNELKNYVNSAHRYGLITLSNGKSYIVYPTRYRKMMLPGM